MDINEKTAIIESILFAGGEPVELDKLCEASQLEKKEILEILDNLKEIYAQNFHGIELLKLNDSYQLVTKKQYADYIKTALEIKKNAILSSAAMEVLTIVAYNQPVTKSFVEHIRGVDSSGTVNTLVEKDLLTEAGRLDMPGRPISYKTTDNFLRTFQISSLSELPPLPEEKKQAAIDEATKEIS